ncbi:hypothetical protein V5J73_03805 [Flavobacterium sp. KS-LB2]|uniref:hypothetical protein n=1 Tax=Flavobacterium sp. KS-LB2 TaxID=3120525 RepID=UPI0030CAFFF5
MSICFFIFFFASAQDTWAPPADSPGFGDSNNDAATNAPSVPIDGIEIPLLVTGIVLAVVVTRRMRKSIA